MSFKKTVGIAAALMLSGSYSAMAATLNVPTGVGGIPLAQEAIVSAATVVTPTASTAVAVAYNQQQGIQVAKVGGFSASQMLLSFTLTGAQFNAGLTAANLIPTLTNGNSCGATIGVQSGGTAGTSTVTFTVDSGSACDFLTFNPGALKGLTAGTNVTVASTLTLASSGAVVDNGITVGANGGIYISVVDANKGSISTAPTAAALNLSGGALGFNVATNVTATTVTSANMSDLVHQTATITDLATRFKLTPQRTATGTLTLSGIPSAVVAAPTLTGTGATCTVPSSGTSTCAFSTAQLVALNGSATAVAGNTFTATFTVNGTTVIAPSTINGKMEVSYASGQTAKDVLFDGPIVAIGTTACAAEFGSMMGKKTTNALTTIRLSNTSGAAGKVYVTATDDKGAHSAVTQITKTNGGASANTVLDTNNLLPAGATIELLGTDIETATLAFDSWSGTTRGRARVYVETAGSATASSLGSAGTSGCKAEAWMCINGTCSIVNQTGNGTDGQQPVAQKN